MPVPPTSAAADPLPARSRFCLAVAEHAPMPMATVAGASHLVCDVNPAFCGLLGKARHNLIGKPFADLVPANDESLTLLDRVSLTGKSIRHTALNPFAPPLAFWSYTLWPVLAEGHPAGVMIQVNEASSFQEQTVAMNEALLLGSVRQHELTEAADISNARLQVEISGRQQVEDLLRRAQVHLTDRASHLEVLVAARTAELTAMNQQLETFVYSIAHDLRAPLRAMQGFSQLLVEEAATALSDAGRSYADRISKSAQFMDALLGDLLAFSRISQQRVELTPVDLKPVVEAVLIRLQKDLQEKDAVVESPGPWPAVLAHAPTLAQVVFNLTSNALKFARPGVPAQVRLRAEDSAGFVRVWVEDNGLGIAPEHQAQIFRLFTRLAGEKYPGTGIGLAIVEKSIARMGGRVGVESAAGHGSRFWFELRKA